MRINRLKIFSIILLVSFIAVNFAFAEDLNESSKGLGGFLYTIVYSIGKGIQFCGQLTNWALNLNNTITTSPTVLAGWGITRDLANLGFVLFIIFIAFGTILRIESYQMKQTLWKLVVVALFINFSLKIAEILIDFTGTMTNFFLSGATDPSQIATSLISTLSPQGLFKPPPPVGFFESILATFGVPSLDFISGILFILIFSVIIAITMIALAAMFYIRYLVLSFLLILMPLAWLFWIFPDLSSHTKKWWSEFIRWCFFAPAASFFIYLAIFTQSKTNSDTLINSITAVSGDALPGMFDFAGARIGQMILIIGILIGGLMTANKMGIAGANAGLNFATKGRNMILGGAAGLVTKPAGWAGRGIVRKAATAGATDEKPSYAQRAANFAAKIPGFTGVAAGINKFAQGPKQSVAEYEKEIKNWSPEMLKNYSESMGATLNEPHAAALANKLVTTKIEVDKKDENGNVIMENGKPVKEKKQIFDTLTKEKQKVFIDVAAKMGNLNKIMASRPDLAGNEEFAKKAGLIPNEDQKKLGITAEMLAVKKLKPKEAADLLSPESIKAENGDKVVLGLSNSQLENIGKENIELKEIILKKFKEMEKDIHLSEVERTTKGLPPLSKIEIDNYDRLEKFMNNNKFWV